MSDKTREERGAQARRERRFYTGITLALAIAVFLGFAPTFYLSPAFPEAAPLAPEESFFYWHGAVSTLWVLLLPLQTYLVRTRNLSLHRSLGIAGVALAILVIVVGFKGALLAANRPGGFLGIPMPPEAFLLIPTADLTIFGLFVTLAVIWRRSAQAHKRLMVLATISMSQAAYARVPILFVGDFTGPLPQFVLTAAFILAIASWDFVSRRRIHPITLWGGLFLFVSLPLRMAFAGTEAWMSVGRWLMSLA